MCVVFAFALYVYVCLVPVCLVCVVGVVRVVRVACVVCVLCVVCVVCVGCVGCVGCVVCVVCAVCAACWTWVGCQTAPLVSRLRAWKGRRQPLGTLDRADGASRPCRCAGVNISFFS